MILIITFIVCMVLGMPIIATIGWACIMSMISGPLPMAFIPQNLYTGMDQFPLIAIVGFVLAGYLMEPAGITEKIIDVAKKVVGSITGGLAIVTILACMIFASLSGSGPATTAAIGSLMIPGMLKMGYSKGFTAGVPATGGTLGILIPPSNPLIIYGVVANCSIAGLFMAGFLPGFILTFFLCATAYVIAKKKGFKGEEGGFSGREFLASVWRGKWALLTPVIILGGIYGGVFTPTEAAEVGALYALFVGIVVTRQLTWKNFTDALIKTASMAGTVTVLVGVSMTFSRLITLYQIPQAVGDFLMSFSTNPTVILLLIALIIVMAGFVADTIAMVVVLAPIFLPVTNKLGIDPIHLGIIFVVCCETGFLTPPFGANLFVSMKMVDVELEELAMSVIPFVLVILFMVTLLVFFPQITMFLPNLLLK
jgi:C4-dicarboxylate transporter DctM subunit